MREIADVRIHHKRPAFIFFWRASVANKQKSAPFSRSGYTRARLRHFLFPVPNYHAEFLTFLRSSPRFLFRVLYAFSLFLRELTHMYSGQSGHQMGTKFRKVLRDKHGIDGG